MVSVRNEYFQSYNINTNYTQPETKRKLVLNPFIDSDHSDNEEDFSSNPYPYSQQDQEDDEISQEFEELELNPNFQLESLAPVTPPTTRVFRIFDRVKVEDYLEFISPALFIKILSYLNIVELRNCARVSKWWRFYCYSRPLWQNINLFEHRLLISDFTITQLMLRCQYLQKLDLKWCREITDKSIQFICEKCGQNLKYLDLNWCDQLTNTSLHIISYYCNHIEYLDLSSIPRISDDGMQWIAKSCTQLRCLLIGKPYLAMTSFITDISITTLAQNCHNLQILNINFCTEITDNAMIQLCKNCTSLLQLEIFGCFQITDLTIQYLTQFCKFMTFLNLGACNLLTEKSIIYILDNYYYIQCIDINGCDKINCNTVFQLLQNRPNLTINGIKIQDQDPLLQLEPTDNWN